MALHNATGIILSSRTLNENDAVSDVLTDTTGICSFVFKALKKSRRRPQAVLEPGCISSFSYYQKNGGFAYVSDYIILFHPQPVADSYEKILALHIMLEIIKKTVASGNNDSYLFVFLQKAIERLPGGGDPYTLLTYFILHFLRHEGILPDLRIPVVINADSKNIDLLLNNHEISAAEKILSVKFQDNEPLDREISERILFNMLLYLEHYYSIRLNGKKLLFSSGKSEYIFTESAADRITEYRK